RQTALAGDAFIIKEIAGVQRAIAQILENRAMKLVRAAFAHNYDLAAASKAVLRAKGIGNDAIFADSIDTKRGAVLRRRGAGVGVGHNGAVEQVVIGA